MIHQFQLILTGDFFQLPPVGKDRVAQYCFEGKSWNQAVDNNVVLTHVFRQKDEGKDIHTISHKQLYFSQY